MVYIRHIRKGNCCIVKLSVNPVCVLSHGESISYRGLLYGELENTGYPMAGQRGRSSKETTLRKG